MQNVGVLVMNSKYPFSPGEKKEFARASASMKELKPIRQRTQDEFRI